jgi:hypothetical protein
LLQNLGVKAASIGDILGAVFGGMDQFFNVTIIISVGLLVSKLKIVMDRHW